MSVVISNDDRQLAAHVCAGDSVFAESFAAAQNGNDEKIMYDEVVPPNEALQERIAVAFAHARHGGWLTELCARCVVDRVVVRDFIAAAAGQPEGARLMRLQTMIGGNSPFKDTLLHAKGLIYATNYICRILIDGHHAGTGLLIPPDMVMTAGHVFDGPHTHNAALIKGTLAQPRSAQRIELLFDDRLDSIEGRRVRLKPRSFSVVDNWLLAHAAPPSNANGVTKDDIGKPDYALIRLAGSPYPYARPLHMESSPPLNGDPVLIIQHPLGKALCHDDGLVEEQVHGTEVFLHSVSSQPGSSGAPCFNTDFSIVGVHTGATIGTTPARNVALGIKDPANAVSKWVEGTKPVRPYFFQSAQGTLHPIVQRKKTLDWLEQAATTGTNCRLLAISPATHRKNGMSFTADFISALLPNEDHRVVRLSALQFHSLTPQAFVQQLLVACGIPFPNAPPPPDGDTTAVAHLRNVLVPELIRELQNVRADRLFWLILDDLRRPDDSHVPLSEGTGLRECLDLIYESVAGYDWLRIVLLGYDSVVPDKIKNFWTNETFEDVPLSAFADYSRELIDRIPKTQRDSYSSLLDKGQQSLEHLPPDQRLSIAAVHASLLLMNLGVQA